MADSLLDLMRQDALKKRVNGIAGGHHIAWSAKDVSRINEEVTSLPERIVPSAPRSAPRKAMILHDAAVQRKLAEAGFTLQKTRSSDALNFLFPISTSGVDLAGDSITPGGIDTRDFARNPVVLNAHDSRAAPIALSTTPWVSGQALMAVAKFPPAGVSSASDQIVAAIRASLVRGASVGFVPLKWTFSKDPARPLGIDFLEIKLLEFSVVALPCNPSCLVIGSVSDGKSARRNAQVDDIADEDGSDWRCFGDGTIPIDSSDDSFDPVAAKGGLLAKCSPNGTIADEAQRYFFAVDVSRPLSADSYMFPFARAADSGCVAAKTGWRASLAAMEKSGIPGLPVGDARALVETLEGRLGDVKTAARRREARELVAEGRLMAASIGDHDPPTSRDHRLFEARNFRRALEGRK